MNYTAVRDVDVVVTGAGQAGLAGAYHLRRAGLEPERDFVVLDHSPGPGGAWQFRWPSLTYGKVHGMHALPGMELTDADPARPSSEVITEYFDAYERTFDLRVRRPVDVWAVREGADGRLREPGGGIRVEGTRAVADPRVHLVGYGPSASTIGASRAGRAAVRGIRRLLAGEQVAA